MAHCTFEGIQRQLKLLVFKMLLLRALLSVHGCCLFASRSVWLSVARFFVPFASTDGLSVQPDPGAHHPTFFDPGTCSCCARGRHPKGCHSAQQCRTYMHPSFRFPDPLSSHVYPKGPKGRSAPPRTFVGPSFSNMSTPPSNRHFAAMSPLTMLAQSMEGTLSLGADEGAQQPAAAAPRALNTRVVDRGGVDEFTVDK